MSLGALANLRAAALLVDGAVARFVVTLSMLLKYKSVGERRAFVPTVFNHK